ncbi:MAG: serine/threonine protein phosphatase, partial [Deltaproteobacteria bacterium]|nr:serine/threonine protein phosphatase [Deltaproteobacteria bacterium]
MNEEKKITWIIGDIHGMYDPLRALITRLDNKRLDKFVFVGDYIDHGPSSKEVLDLIIELGDKAVPLMGNHEYLLLLTLYNEDHRKKWGKRIWVEDNGGQQTIHSFGCADFEEFEAKIEPKYTDFLKSLKFFHQVALPGDEISQKFLIT